MSVASSIAPLSARVRALGFAACWILFFAASPGVLVPDGSAVLATAAVVPWALCARAPGRRAFWIEWLFCGAGISATCFWSTKVLWITLLVVAIVPGLYVALAGVLLRVLVRRVPLWLATPVAWVSLETLRATIEPPFGFGWMRLGHHAHQIDWLAGSARVWGVAGLSFVLAAAAGAFAEWQLARRTQTAAPASPLRRAVPLIGAASCALAAFAAAKLTRPPELTTGPRVLLVQPAFEQHRKMTSPSAIDLFRESVELTERGLREARARGERPVEFVAWGEAMMPFSLGDTGLDAALAAGARPPAWSDRRITRTEAEFLASNEREAVRGLLFGADGGSRVLPEGANFVSGTDFYAVDDGPGGSGEIRRWNAVVGWNPAGERVGWVSKQHLVPGGEMLCGLERFAWVRSTALALANYVPDLVSRAEPRALVFPRASGGEWRVGVSVCFDNTFEGPFAAPLRAGPLDFHLVCSNEAWYEESWEYDQMLAFSRLAAIATARSVVRATNAGVSTVFDPAGRELARLVVGGKDRMVGGTLRADVPVPVVAERARRTPFVVLERAWTWLFILLPAVVAAAGYGSGYRAGYRRRVTR